MFSFQTSFGEVTCISSSSVDMFYRGKMSLIKFAVIFYIIIIVMVIRESAARPSNEWPSGAFGCLNADSAKIEICQRCAKQTKSPIVYPMCCNEEDEVHFWCYRYTTYGKVA